MMISNSNKISSQLTKEIIKTIHGNNPKIMTWTDYR